MRITLRHAIVLAGLAGLALVVGLLLARIAVLDARLDRALAGDRPAAARVYAEPFAVRAGGEWSPAALERELARLHYRHRTQATAPGTYARDGATFRVHLRANGGQPARVLTLTRDGDGAAVVVDAARRARAELALEPAELGTLGDGDRRGPDDAVPALLPALVLAVEDRRFHSHAGVDLRAAARAAWRNLRAGGIREGGSTITQQLARTLLLDGRRTWTRKLDEALYAVLLERRLAKREVLDLYLREVYLGQDGERAIRGFAAAGRHWFGRPLAELAPHELALLVGLVRGPTYYHPRRAPERALARRDLVLRLAAAQGVLAPEAAALARAAPLLLERPDDPLVHFAALDRVRRELRAAGFTGPALSGAVVHTTLRPWEQEAAQAAVAGALARVESQAYPAARDAGNTRDAGERERPPLQAAAAVLAPDGAILALVGGRGASAGFNRALDARRPIGSLAKPFVFLSALRTGRYHAATPVEDETYPWHLADGSVWVPTNYGGGGARGTMPLVRALADSSNLATVNVGFDVGVPAVLDTLRELGLGRRVRPVPAVLLGALDLAPLEVAQLYAALANGGQRVQPHAVARVLTADGREHRLGGEPEPAVERSAAHQLAHMLTQVVDRGTGRPARRVLPPRLRVAGKTGTSSDGRDSWFAGFGGDHVVAVWVGRDDFGPTPLNGARGALPVWATLVRELGTRSWDPLPPFDLVAHWVDRGTGIAVPGDCGGTAMPVLVARYAPLPYSEDCLPPDLPWDADAPGYLRTAEASAAVAPAGDAVATRPVVTAVPAAEAVITPPPVASGT